MSIPSFRGKHNQLKCQAWLLLAICRDTGYWLTSEQIASILGVNIRSLRTALTKWTAWKRVLRKRRQSDYVYLYQISARGYKWVYKYQSLIKPEYFDKVYEWKRRQIGY